LLRNLQHQRSRVVRLDEWAGCIVQATAEDLSHAGMAAFATIRSITHLGTKNGAVPCLSWRLLDGSGSDLVLVGFA
jgi:hypothetical protein